MRQKESNDTTKESNNTTTNIKEHNQTLAQNDWLLSITYQRPIISEPYLRGQHNLYAMKQINKKTGSSALFRVQMFSYCLWQRQGTLWRCCDAEITHQRWSFFSSSSPLYHEFNSCGRSFCNTGVVMLYVLEYGLKLLASAQTRRLWCGIDAREFPTSPLSAFDRGPDWVHAARFSNDILDEI